MIISLPTKDSLKFVEELLNKNVGDCVDGSKISEISYDKFMDNLSIIYQFEGEKESIKLEMSEEYTRRPLSETYIKLFEEKFKALFKANPPVWFTKRGEAIKLSAFKIIKNL